MSSKLEILIEATDNATKVLNQAGDAMKGVEEKTSQANEQMKVSADKVSVSAKDQALAFNNLATGCFGLYNAVDNVMDAQLGVDRANYQVKTSAEAVERAQKAYNATVEKYGPASEEAKQAADNLALAEEKHAMAVEKADIVQGNYNENIVRSAITVIPSLITTISSGVSVFGTMKTALENSAGAQKLLNLAMEANPILIVVAAIGILIGALITLYYTCEPVKNAIDGIGRFLGLLPPAIDEVTKRAAEDAKAMADVAQSHVDAAKRMNATLVAQSDFTFTLYAAEKQMSSYNEILGRNCVTLGDWQALNRDASGASDALTQRIKDLQSACDSTNAALQTQIDNLTGSAGLMAFTGRHGDDLSARERELGSTISDLNQNILDNVTATEAQIQAAIDLQAELEKEAEHAANMADLIGELSNSYNVLEAQADTSLGNIHAAYDDCFATGNFDAMAAIVDDFAVKHNISLDDAKETIESYVDKVAEIPKSIEEQLVGRAQANLEAFKNCATGKFATIEGASSDSWDAIVKDTNDLISSGLVGQAQNNIKAFVDCSTGKQAKMVDDVDGYLSKMTADYDANTKKVADLVAAGKTVEAAIYSAKGAEILAKIQQLEDWRNAIVTGAWNQTNTIVQSGLSSELGAVATATSKLQALAAQFGQAGVSIREIAQASKAQAEAVAAALANAISHFGEVGFDVKLIAQLAAGKIPMAQEGGIVTRPTLLVAGEAGPEAIVPLGRGVPEGYGGGKVSEIHIYGPLVHVEGSLDRQTAQYVAGLIEERLKNVLVEASSSGAGSTHKRIRVSQ